MADSRDSIPTVNEKGGEPRDPTRSAPSARYEIGTEIARGGMGRVVEATDSLLGRVVAVKEALQSDDDSLRRFLRETKITARLEHPSIVPVYDAGRLPDGSPYYVMRKVSGRSLEDVVAEAGTLDRRLALIPHVLAAAQAVAHAHRRGVIHRDLKPSNILVGNLGETVVIDWGIAKVIDEPEDTDDPNTAPIGSDAGQSLKTRLGVMVGTPGFMPPEQMAGEAVDERSDVYALGATLYYLLAQRPPHAAPSGTAMIDAAVAGPPIHIGKLVGGIPPELSTIVDTALTYDRDRRYADAAGFAEDLGRFLAGQLVASHHYSRRERVAKFVRKNRGAVAIAVVAVVAIAIGAWVSIGRVIAARDEAISEKRHAEGAQKAEAERSLELTINKAQLLLDSNPTSAVAMVKPLAATARWREVRAIAADAASAGVAWRLPSSPYTESAEMSPDGRHALSTGNDGVVRYYDLAARTTIEVANVKGPLLARFIDNNHIIAGDGAAKNFVIVELSTHQLRNVEIAAPVVEIVGVDGRVFWCDRDGHLWRLDRGGSTPISIPIDDHVFDVAPSPDGMVLAVRGQHAVWLTADRTAQLVTGRATKLNWAATGDRLAVLMEKEVLDLHLADPITLTRTPVPDGMRSVAIIEGHVYASGDVGIVRDGQPMPEETEPVPHDLYDAGGLVVTGSILYGDLMVIDRGTHERLKPPLKRMTLIRASRNSRYIITGTHAALFAWDLAPVFPRRIPTPLLESVAPVGGHDLLVIDKHKAATWVDLATGVMRPGPHLDGEKFSVSPSGNTVLVFDAAHHVVRVRRGETTFDPVFDEEAVTGFLDEHRIAYATTHGDVRMLDLDTHAATALGHVDAAARDITTHGAWVTVMFDNGTVWRHNLDTKRTETRTRERHDRLDNVLIGTDDGRVWFPDDAILRCWHPDGTVTSHLTLPQSITRVLESGTERAVVTTLLKESFLVDLSTPDRNWPLDGITPRFSNSPSTELLGVPTRDALIVVDQTTGVRWRTARHAGLTLTPDATIVFGMAVDEIRVWPVGYPTSPAATAAWLDSMTNLTGDARTGELVLDSPGYAHSN